jgi:hypothetical protein
VDNVLPWVQVGLLAFLLVVVLAMLVRGWVFGFDGSERAGQRSAADPDKETPPPSWPAAINASAPQDVPALSLPMVGMRVETAIADALASKLPHCLQAVQESELRPMLQAMLGVAAEAVARDLLQPIQATEAHHWDNVGDTTTHEKEARHATQCFLEQRLRGALS